MKHRLDAQGGTIQELRNANHALQAENDKLKDKITQLEAQIKELQKQKCRSHERRGGTLKYFGHIGLADFLGSRF